MNDEVCEGCGIPLQSDHPNAPGYVPSHIARRADSVICRRCYRINHYGKEDEGVRPNDEQAASVILDVISDVDLSVMIVDIIDFEGSILPALAHAAEGRLFVAVNKVDLLPSKTPVPEVVDWVTDRLRAEGIVVEGVYPISASEGYGVRVLFEAARKRAGRGGKVALVGATNVGKSTLLSRWLGDEADGPTVSRFPGTTLGLVQREMRRSDLEIVDTPGLSTRGRLTDVVCLNCAAKLVPETPLSSKLLRVSSRQSVIMGGLAAITPVGPNEGDLTMLVFAAGDVPIQKVKQDRLDRWLHGEPIPGRHILCDACRNRTERDGWEEIQIEVDEMEDLAVLGLGWISPRHRGFKARVTVPAGAMVAVRPRLIGPKKRRVHERAR